MPPPWLQRGGFKLLPVAAFLKICGQAETSFDTATQLGESLVAMLRNPRDWLARPLQSCVCRYNLATLWQGWLAYIRYKDPLLRWLERAQHRMGAYEEGGVARLRDLEAYRVDVMDEA